MCVCVKMLFCKSTLHLALPSVPLLPIAMTPVVGVASSMGVVFMSQGGLPVIGVAMVTRLLVGRA